MISPSRFRGLACWVVALPWVCALAGCGGDGPLPTQPLVGKVTLDDKPLAGAEIWLVPTDSNAKVTNAKMTIRPYAKTKADGTFTVTSYFADDGAPVGEYAIMVVVEGAQADTEEARETDTPSAKKGKGRRVPAFPAKYKDPTTSGLSVTVKVGPNQLDLDLKSK